MELKGLIVRIENNQAFITLNKPETGNALNLDMVNSLHYIIDRFLGDNDIRYIIFSGEGKHFCSGADLRWMKNSINITENENKKEAKILANLFEKIHNTNKITISYISGACIGGGMGLAAACDFVIADSSAFFMCSEVRLGLIPATIAPYIINRIGYQKSKRIMLTAERVDAQSALLLGLADYIESISKDQLTFLIEDLEKGGPEAKKEVKDLLHKLKSLKIGRKDLNTYTSELIAKIRTSDEAIEGITAFLEKRQSLWK